MRNYLLLALSIILVGCGGQEVLETLKVIDSTTESAAALGIPYSGVANMLTGFLVEFVRGRIEKKSILKHAGALYRGVDEHLKSLSPEEKTRALEIMDASVKKIVGNKRLVKAKKFLNMAKTISKGA